jgi:CHASE1-domain containing sensor protein
VFIVVACASLVTAWLSYVGAQDAARIKFESAADDALSRIESNLDLNLSLLTSTRAFLRLRGPDMSRVQFRQFFDALDVARNFPGLRDIGYLKMVRTGHEEDAERDIVKAQGVERGVYPETDQEWRTPVILFEPLDEKSLVGVGYDMFADPVRRAAIEGALASGETRATARLQLEPTVSNGRTSPGFLAFAPLPGPTGDNGEEGPIGFLYAAFWAESLFSAALGKAPSLPVNVEIYDDKLAPDTLLFRSAPEPSQTYGENLAVARQTKVAGRTWHLVFRPTSAFSPPTSLGGPFLICFGGILLAAAIALIFRLQNQAMGAETALRLSSEKALLERELILQEMKHRIKNSIARMLAIARQTGANSHSIEEFNTAFAARLQAMSASQDMLTRSKWQKADLDELLRTELEQVFGHAIGKVRLSGPPVELNENTTQALGLTFHELATNALKYGEATSEKGSLSVEWAVARSSGRKYRLVLSWKETNLAGIAKPSRTGFGTTLIDMNITRELGGTIRRDFGDNGLTIEIDVPLED